MLETMYCIHTISYVFYKLHIYICTIYEYILYTCSDLLACNGSLKDPINISILHFGFKASDKGGFQKPWFAGSTCVCGVLGPT